MDKEKFCKQVLGLQEEVSVETLKRNAVNIKGLK